MKRIRCARKLSTLMLDLEETGLEIKMSLKEMGRFISEMDILQLIKDITLQKTK